jgi:hypothetical protein
MKDGPKAPADLVIRALRNYIDIRRAEGPVDDAEDEDVGYCLGYLYAQALVTRLGWELVFLKTDFMAEGEVAVVSPDRRHAAYPAMFVYRLLRQPTRDNTVALTVNMLAAGNWPPVAERAYSIVLG